MAMRLFGNFVAVSWAAAPRLFGNFVAVSGGCAAVIGITLAVMRLFAAVICYARYPNLKG